MEKMIIAGFAGIGKTTLAKKYKNVVDLESSPYKWDYSNFKKIDYEKMKGNLNRKPNPYFPDNYISAIKKAVKNYDVICVWLNFENALPYYEKNNIDYTICYPSKEAFEEYRQLYVNRGNNEDWINKVCNHYYKVFSKLEALNKPKIILNKGETLEDVLIKHGVKLIKK